MFRRLKTGIGQNQEFWGKKLILISGSENALPVVIGVEAFQLVCIF
jgi:hypothetical protein